MHGVNANLNKDAKDNDDLEGENKLDERVFVNGGHPLGGKKRRQGAVFTLDVPLMEQAHRYALFNSDCEEVNDYIREHEAYLEHQPRQTRWEQAQNHSHEFSNWFKDKVFYVPDPVVDGLHYVVKTIPRDIYDFDEENNETDGEFYWCEPDEDRLGSSAQASEQETRLSREDIPPLVVDASTKLDATNVFDSENGDDSDNDDTIWDWMHADEDDDNGVIKVPKICFCDQAILNVQRSSLVLISVLIERECFKKLTLELELVVLKESS
ncbi:hypothetical protein QVD17_39638 [Tagetes erecta]|uniref:Uncharacterized protein n=1 Tax=Tagetes erecta TaxID=13708 RepID=A0AAD8JQE5_TARER|nr:hypothetical protein QVD17_39638 [Tagetes erecta]